MAINSWRDGLIVEIDEKCPMFVFDILRSLHKFWDCIIDNCANNLRLYLWYHGKSMKDHKEGPCGEPFAISMVLWKKTTWSLLAKYSRVWLLLIGINIHNYIVDHFGSRGMILLSTTIDGMLVRWSKQS